MKWLGLIILIGAVVLAALPVSANVIHHDLSPNLTFELIKSLLRSK